MTDTRSEGRDYPAEYRTSVLRAAVERNLAKLPRWEPTTTGSAAGVHAEMTEARAGDYFDRDDVLAAIAAAFAASSPDGERA